ncbi:MAG: hypothetical protein O2924_04960 [Chloroflexi bacterium]|nr:hypothetical protein [Chloroflexota bacterium]MDA1010080.1 hypothetical protein [Chloroflexota bacterium]
MYDPYALDVWRIGGSTGGSLLLAPMSGQIGYVASDCLSIRNDAVNLLMCHVFPTEGLERGMPVVTGQVIGVVAPDGQANNNGTAHIHLQLNLRNAQVRTGDPLPFVGPFALEGQEFPETIASNAHYGVQVTSTNTIVAGAAAPAAEPTVSGGPDQTAAPGDQVTLTASATAASTVTWQQVGGTSVLSGTIAAATLTFTAPAETPEPLRFVVVAEGQGGIAVAQVSVAVVSPPAPPPSSYRGRIVSGNVDARGVSLIVFGGGTPEELVATLSCAGVVSVWASGTDGGFIRYDPSAPAFVNAQWFQRFPDGLPEFTPLLINCQ